MKLIYVVGVTFTFAIQSFGQAAGPSQGPVLSAGINNTRFVVNFNGQGTIQNTVNAAIAIGAKAEVVIPAGATPIDTIAGVTGGNSTVWIIDERALPWTCYTWQGSSYSSSGVNCSGGSGSSSWSALTSPSSNLALTMGANTTTFTFGSSTGAADLFAWKDGASNSGTGILGHFNTATGSTEIPWQADANGVGWQVAANGALQSVGSGAHGLTFSAGSMVAGAAGKVVYGVDATSGFGELNENNTGASRICTTANGQCASGGVTDATVTIGTTAISANACSTVATITMTGLATTMTLNFTPNSDVHSVTGWGPATPGLYIIAWPSAANTASYYVCNSSGSSITPGGSVTFNISAR